MKKIIFISLFPLSKIFVFAQLGEAFYKYKKKTEEKAIEKIVTEIGTSRYVGMPSFISGINVKNNIINLSSDWYFEKWIPIN